jgi:hypothetical protein
MIFLGGDDVAENLGEKHFFEPELRA